MSIGPPPMIHNPFGPPLSGSDPNFAVPRLGPDGQWRQRTNEQRVQDAQFMGRGGGFSSPLDFIDNVIRREDFPPGPEGDAAFEAALEAFGAGGAPTGSAGRTPGYQANFDARQAAQATAQGGSSSLAVISWAQNHPQEALHALMAMDAGAVIDPYNWLDDATIRDIVTGLGGVDAVNQMIAAERQRLIESGQIPQPQGTLTQPDPGRMESIGEHIRNIPDGDAARQPFSPGSGNGAVAHFGGGRPPGMTIDHVFGMPNIVDPGFHRDFDSLPPDMQAAIRGLEGGFQQLQPVDAATRDAIWQGIHDGTLQVQPRSRPRIEGSFADPRAGITNRQEPRPVGVPEAPFTLEQNGQIVGTEPLPNAYQYTQVGQDVYLDVTDPTSGQVHRFTGDVVQAVYSAHGATSFDELVAQLGYDAAVAALFSFITPPPAPSTGPVVAPAPAPGGGGGGGVPTPPAQPRPNRPGETTGRDPGFTR